MRFEAQIPKELGGYRLIRQLGRGGMAEVWLAFKEGDPLEKPWVVKVLLPEHTTSTKHRERFHSEVKTLASLRHGRIVAIHDFGEDRGFLYLVMEYIDGVNLRVFVNALAVEGERIPLVAVLYIMGEIFDALRHAHDRTRAGTPRGVIHRDVTPSNVLVSSEGEVFLTDFGLARYEQEFSFEMFGTLGYMAPEQARGAACPQSDLFGAGGVLHFMLTGAPPRQVTNPMEIEAMLDDPPPPTGRDDVPAILERIRQMCLAPSLLQRFESAADCLELIEQYEGYQRTATVLKRYHLRYFGPPRTGTTEALAMANPTAAAPRTVPLPPPPKPQAEAWFEANEVTTFWHPPSSPRWRPWLDGSASADVPTDYRPAPGGFVEADAPKVRRRPRRGAPTLGEPTIEPTEVLLPPEVGAGPSSSGPGSRPERLGGGVAPEESQGEMPSSLVELPHPPRRTVVATAPASRSHVGIVAMIGVVSCSAALAIVLTGSPKARPGADGPRGQEADASVAQRAADGRVALGATASPEPDGSGERRSPPPRQRLVPVVVVVGGVADGEVQLGETRILLDPIAHTSVRPGRYPLRWRAATNEEWRDAGFVDVLPEDLEGGLLRIQVSASGAARVERGP